jgi:hypothetical protein
MNDYYKRYKELVADSMPSKVRPKYIPIGPRWFNPNSDMVLLKTPVYRYPPRSISRYSRWYSPSWDIDPRGANIWNHGRLEFSKMKHLAFEIDMVGKSHLYKVPLTVNDPPFDSIDRCKT